MRLLGHPVAVLRIPPTPMITASIFDVVLLRIHHFILTMGTVAMIVAFACGRALRAIALLRMCLITSISVIIVERLGIYVTTSPLAAASLVTRVIILMSVTCRPCVISRQAIGLSLVIVIMTEMLVKSTRVALATNLVVLIGSSIETIGIVALSRAAIAAHARIGCCAYIVLTVERGITCPLAR